MFGIKRILKLRRIGERLANEIETSIWRALPQIFEGSEKAVQVMQRTKDGQRIWDCYAVLFAFGTHVVDHYARNYLDEKERKRLVRRLLECLVDAALRTNVMNAAKVKKRLSFGELATCRKALLKLMKKAIDMLEESTLMHRSSGPSDRGDVFQTSLATCGILLLGALSEESDVPKVKLESWDEMDPAALALFDCSRTVAWGVHEAVKNRLGRLFEEEGFVQIRDFGTVL